MLSATPGQAAAAHAHAHAHAQPWLLPPSPPPPRGPPSPPPTAAAAPPHVDHIAHLDQHPPSPGYGLCPARPSVCSPPPTPCAHRSPWLPPSAGPGWQVRAASAVRAAALSALQGSSASTGASGCRRLLRRQAAGSASRRPPALAQQSVFLASRWSVQVGPAR